MVTAFAPMIDRMMAPTVWLAAHQLMLVRKLTPGRAPHCMRALDRVGIYPLIDHYYEPMINPRHLHRPLDFPRPLAGLKLDADAALAFLEGLTAVPEFLAEQPLAPRRSDAETTDSEIGNSETG